MDKCFILLLNGSNCKESHTQKLDATIESLYILITADPSKVNILLARPGAGSTYVYLLSECNKRGWKKEGLRTKGCLGNRCSQNTKHLATFLGDGKPMECKSIK